MAMFRDLKASEIDCRIAQINSKGLSLLLYKDARVDQNILDETVTPYNWQRKQEMIGGNLYCTVSIYDNEKGEWISKQDVGTESYTEKEKGQASDAFKRACFNWGIGRELYTAPFIWIPAGKCNIQTQGGKQRCYDDFYVSNITIKDKVITELEISVKNKVVYSMNRKDMPDKDVPAEPVQEETNTELLPEPMIKTLEECIPKHDGTVRGVCKYYGVKRLCDLTVEQFTDCMNRMGEKS